MRNGEVLSLLTNEDNPPSEIIGLLKPSMRMKVSAIRKGHQSQDVTVRAGTVRWDVAFAARVSRGSRPHGRNRKPGAIRIPNDADAQV